MASFETVVPGQLTVHTYARFAPFCYEKDGAIVGTDIDFLSRFAEHEGLHARFEATDFPAIWELPGLGECDIAAAGIATLGHRDPGAGGRWSKPYTVVRRSLLVRAGEAEHLRTPEDFVGRTIVVTRDSTADMDARKRYEPLGATVLAELPTQDAMVTRLLGGAVDAYAGGETSNRFVAAADERLAVVDVHEMDDTETLHFTARAADPRLLERLDAFIESQQY